MALALLVMTGWVTMLGIACWPDPGGSYRPVHIDSILWCSVCWLHTKYFYAFLTNFSMGSRIIATLSRIVDLSS